jgi:hypothetical protein
MPVYHGIADIEVTYEYVPGDPSTGHGAEIVIHEVDVEQSVRSILEREILEAQGPMKDKEGG